MLKCLEKSPRDNLPINPFTLTPRKSEPKTGTADPNDHASDRHAPQTLQLASCLIVDDSPLNRKLLERHLKPHFTLLRTAENGLKGVEEVKRMIDQQLVFDLICLDSIMPVSPPLLPSSTLVLCSQEMGGPEAIAQIRKLGYGGLVVGVTGNALPDQISDFISAGVDMVLPKPVDIDALLQIISSHHRLSSEV
jgi:CheY-like chemotaxis protein